MANEDDGSESVFTGITRLTLWATVDSMTSHKSEFGESSNSGDSEKRRN